MASERGCRLLRSAPYFPVADVAESASYYERVFGFRREYVGGAPPEFAICSRDGHAVMLRKVPAPERILPNIQDTYNMREFAVRDRDGHVLGFGQALTRPSSRHSVIRSAASNLAFP